MPSDDVGGQSAAISALEALERSVPVTVVTRALEPQESNTYWAQGGIIYRGTDDSPELLEEDLTRVGAGHCNPKAVAILAEEGPDILCLQEIKCFTLRNALHYV